MGYRRPYTIFPRTLASGRVVYYYQTRDSQGRRTTAHSTGKTSKKRAIEYCEGLRDQGRLMPLPNSPMGPYIRRFIPWANSPHVLALRTRGKGVRSVYAKKVDAMINSHILPWWEDVRWSEMTPASIEAWYVWLREKRLAQHTVFNVATVMRTIIRWAHKKDRLIHANPFHDVDALPAGSASRGVPTLEEARALFADGALERLWEGSELNYGANLLAMLTAMRMGEILAITDLTAFGDHIHVDASWSPYTGRGPTKTGAVDDVPIPPKMTALLSRLRNRLEVHPGYLFSRDGGRSPINQDTPREALYRALRGIGVDEMQRRARNITFHSWRHFCNTYLRSQGVADSLVRAVTHHATELMTERYTHFELDHYRPVLDAQEKMLG